MKVLVVETEPDAASAATRELEAAGHQVERCHEPGAERAFPCIGLAGRCPLEGNAIDVALTVRSESHPSPTPFEDGVTCALRQHIPVVVAGPTSPNPFEPFDGTTVAHGDVVDACEQAVASHRLRHEAVAMEALGWTLRFRDLPTATARVEIVRSGSRLRVKLIVPAETPKVVRDMAAVRVTGAIRAFDPFAPHIDISCEPSA